MPCRDGIRLATRLWRPAGDGPAPVLLMRQPYGRAIASTVTYAHPAWYAAHGFLVAIQDVRGRGASEGDFAGFGQEAQDGAEAVRWARRLPGGNGAVGLYGFSYQGLTQLLIDLGDGDGDDSDDPLPDCLAPACCGLDERLHWASEGGAHWWGLGLGWGLQLAAEGCRRRGDAQGWQEIRSSLETGAFLRDGLDLLQRHDPSGMAYSWLRRDPRRAAEWRRHPVATRLLRRPMLLIAAWHDPHLRGSLDLWRRARRAGGQPWLRIGAWTHLDWRGGLDQLQLAFFRAHLGHAGNSAPERDPQAEAAPSGPSPAERKEEAVVLVASPALDPQRLVHRRALQAGEDGAWRPATATPALAWRLQSTGLAAARCDEGLLVAEARWRSATPGQGRAATAPTGPEQGGAWLRTEDPRGSARGMAGAVGGPLVLVHDPWRPVPGRGGHLGLDAGLVAREDLDRRADVACFTSAPLTEPLRLEGVPQLVIAVEADQPGFDLCAALSLLTAEGRAWQLSTGVARFLGDHCLRLRRRRVQLQPLLRELRPGQRLRLSLAAAAWPQIGVNPGDGSPWARAVSPSHRLITLRFDLCAARLWMSSMFGAN
ncbi:MAG: CocE/NonD family hydrolase [Synechococcaceae cyanobacterium]|nr:CocE/NonD family hydrolase [Synechococcaceae cyanobacterium]